VEGPAASTTQVSSFSATPQCTDVELHWTTTAEVDVDRFILERGPDVAGPFVPIAEIVPTGAGTYGYLDLLLSPGAAYHYRLRERILLGSVNELATVATTTALEQTFYADADGDGFGDLAATQVACAAPVGYVADASDCDDTNPAVHPGAPEVCNGVDDDCDGLTDGADPGIMGQATWYADADGDGYGNAAVTQLGCTQPTGFVANSADCDDTNGGIHPGAVELCNGVDDDCDSVIDDADPDVIGQTTWFADADGDGYGNQAISQIACFQPQGYVANSGDCDDASAGVHPGATEVCNGLDDDCDAVIDPGCQPPPDMHVYHIAVTHGDATLIVGPTGTTCLIDGGFIGNGSGAVLAQIALLGLASIDYTIVTHHHDDHYAGITELANAGFLPVVAAYDRGTVNQPTSDFFFAQYVAAVGSRRATMEPGTVIDLGAGATLTCVVANGVAVGGGSVPVAGMPGEENARSLALLLKYGEFEEAICGDLTGGLGGTPDVQALAGPLLGDVDVYKVCHHGSSTSTSPAFLGTLAPEICTVSCGSLLTGLPFQGTLNLLLGQPNVAAVYRLLQGGNAVGGSIVNGTLHVTTNGSSYTCSGGLITPLTRNVDETFGPPGVAHFPGDVVVSEYMADPAVVADSVGEWIELRSTRSTPINLLGFSLKDQGTNFFVLPSLTLTDDGHLVDAAN
jgi:beta-lactamase superfamily II metal-dependent hydrolase